MVSVNGLTELASRLEDARAKLADTENVLQTTGDMVKQAFIDNFESEGGDLGAPWASLSARTLLERAKLGFGPGPILKRTGHLADSFVVTINGKSVVIGNTASYYLEHQLGVPGRRLPARKMALLPDWLREDVTNVFQEFVDQAFAI